MEGATSSRAEEPADGDAADRVRSHLRLVTVIGRQFTNRGVDLSDLIQEGSIGLIKASLRFDQSHGVQFSTYAAWWIRQRMGRAIIEQGRTVRLPGHVSAALREIAQMAHHLAGRLGRPALASEIAERLDLPLPRVERFLGTRVRQVSLDAPIENDGGDLRLLDVMPDERSDASPQGALEARLTGHEIRRALAKLRPREREVVRLRFGLDEEPRSLREVAERLNLQLHDVRQIERRAMKKLRHNLALRELLET
jgi:RNA polymerase primary sigma factor